MDKTLIETLKQWNITSVLPPSVGAFQLSAEFQTVYREGDEEEFCLFRYRLAAKPWSVRAVYTPSAAEFSVRTDLGMLEFALIDFITDDWERFRHLVATRLVRIMTDYYVHCEHNFTEIVKEKGLPEVRWDSFLPSTYEGFIRYLQPCEAVRIVNGSYMILSYYEAATESGLSLMYNVLRDDFFAEQRVYNFPHSVHDFDSTSVADLQDALQTRLLPVLTRIRREVEEKRAAIRTTKTTDVI